MASLVGSRVEKKKKIKKLLTGREENIQQM